MQSIASPMGEMKRSFIWTILFKSPTSSTLCIGEPTLGKLNQNMLLCSPTSSILFDHILANLNQGTEFVSPSTFIFVTLFFTLELPSLCIDLLLKQTQFPTATPV